MTSQTPLAPRLRLSGRRRVRTAVAVLAAAGALVGAVLLGVGLHDQKSARSPGPSAAGVIQPQLAPMGAAPGGSADGGPPAVLPRSEPTAVAIPAIGVRSGLERLGVNADGSVAVPISYSTAGWFTRSVTPGQVGPLVLLGHVDSTNGPGVFYRLGRLRPGDVVTAARADGRAATYRITGVREYAKNDFPTLDVYADTAVPTIRLITCGGRFDAATGHYESNIIAFGQLTST